MECFNPHPAFWPGASHRPGPWRRGCSRFNPHPAFWPGARGDGLRRNAPKMDVSILTRPSGRVQARYTTLEQHRQQCFNPHPAFWPGASREWLEHLIQFAVFQSSPGLLAGCKRGPGAGWLVGIEFQSSPGLLAGCKLAPCRQPRRLGGFQSSPGLLAGCKPSAQAWPRPPPMCFNPHPAFWPGASLFLLLNYLLHHCFNPHPAFWPGASPAQRVFVHLGRFQSSPGLLAGCKFLWNFPRLRDELFQSSPGLLAGCKLSSPKRKDCLH